MTDEELLNQLRIKIDQIDDNLLELISDRARLAEEVAKAKGEPPKQGGYYRPDREASILRRILEQNAGPLADEEMARLFREIISACLALEKPLKIAYLGPAGTFTQGAALKHFGHSIQTEPFDAIDEVFREVESGSCDYGVVPVENSIEGVINHTLDSFIRSPLKICGEVALRIHHHLLARDTELKNIKTVIAHQQALAQCRQWLNHNLPDAERISVSSNAEAARQVASQTTDQSGMAAIAGESAADLYGVQKLVANIEDESTNTTRFLIIGSKGVPATSDDKTSLLFSTQNKPGALFHSLAVFDKYQISMAKIESRPSRQEMWDYLFFVDVVGHIESDQISNALRELEDHTSMLKVLGSYPKAVL
ncbi:MAG: prephenate dehydratase [Gammaproteobacteria bacterium]